MANKVLIIFAHPRYENSINNSHILKTIRNIPGVKLHDLYEAYPDFNVDIEQEKKLLSDHNIIIWQHPFYWYSCPPLLKQWIDLVLEFGWAYGPGGNALQGKIVFNSITSGGPRTAYSREGHNRFTVRELLSPFDQTAVLCKMIYLPPFAIHGTHRLSAEEISGYAETYKSLILKLVNDDYNIEEMKNFAYINDWIENLKN
ncbi:MAG: NAD(P)H-dependent oxidoreductase [Bacteroidales bacterium]|nr:NAD(P)H-dependent oxidoreductase [Bacteroidales bacterium]MCB9000093.1 NAD(P)H-dependent oxidoreductase [Bacteroidales bacterium]MCB9012742.1 NAD(P)H-dependent oxidoreductase [Bacteroidales bacterium]